MICSIIARIYQRQGDQHLPLTLTTDIADDKIRILVLICVGEEER